MWYWWKKSGCQIKSTFTLFARHQSLYCKSPCLFAGRNQIEKGLFHADAWFFGQNVFDTLVLYAGVGNANGIGNSANFQADSTQFVMDSLRIRGIQCASIALHSMGYPVKEAFIRKDNGDFPVDCDYLDIYGVGTRSENNVEFYAGINSKSYPLGMAAPQFWILDNSQGYIPGFNGRTDYYCQGETYVIDGDVFNGDENTQYYWNGSPYPGGNTYPVAQPGTYPIIVEYYPGCSVEDYIVVARIFGREATEIPPRTLYCEGWEIPVEVNPGNGSYEYTWSTGETTDRIVASMDLDGTGIYVEVKDKTNNCVSTPNRTVVVNPTPIPQVCPTGTGNRMD
ncbi:MAG: hypothetical protein R2764_08805 [Bacteroidales bacterium]